jgi:hypothetical protein
MKALIILSFGFLFYTGVSHAQTSELTPKAEKLIFAAIADYVYLEANGLVRAPQKTTNFNYSVVGSEAIQVEGKSFSALDNKEIGYSCRIEVLGRGIIESPYDFEITYCELKI